MSKPDDESTPSIYLREWRKKRGMGLVQLAKIVGSSASAISRFERGDRSIKVELQFKVMRALDITWAQLFSHPDQPTIEALISRAPPELREQLAKMVKPLLPDDF